MISVNYPLVESKIPKESGYYLVSSHDCEGLC